MLATVKINSGKAKLATTIAGTGEPVVFLHANVCDKQMWKDQILAIGSSHKTIAYDRRGFGLTEAAPESFSGLTDLLAVLDAVADDKPAILVGCSLGGRIALDAALQHQSRVRALVLISPSVTGAPSPTYNPKVQALINEAIAIEATHDLDALTSIKARLWLDGPLSFEGRVKGPARTLFHEMYGTALRSPSVGREIDLSLQFDRLQDINIPTLVIWGDLDFPHIQERCRKLTTILHHAVGQEMPSSAHLPSLDNPDETTSLISAFLRQIRV